MLTVVRARSFGDQTAASIDCHALNKTCLIDQTIGFQVLVDRSSVEIADVPWRQGEKEDESDRFPQSASHCRRGRLPS